MELKLAKQNLNLAITELYKKSILKKLDKEFLLTLTQENKELALALKKQRKNQGVSDESELIIKLAPYLENFLISLFNLEKKQENFKQQTKAINELLEFKKNIIQRKILKQYRNDDFNDFDHSKIESRYKDLFQNFNDLNFFKFWQEANDETQDNLMRYIAWACLSDQGKRQYENNVIFNIQEKLNLNNLINLEPQNDENNLSKYQLNDNELEHRKGFSLTDKGPNLEKSLNEANLCLYCHNRQKDSCRHGLYDKEGNHQKSPTNIELKGCPLKEKISEMNLLKQSGHNLAALATAMIDNPLLAATGHRICNDCMKSCIFQAQEPVNIPEIETATLKEILNLDYGFEIYSLLTRWNPLNFANYLPKSKTNKNVLIVGFGPAGFNLAHHLLNSGHNITAIDGLKIEPLEAELSGIDEFGKRHEFKAIKNVEKEIFEDLDKRIPQGFGGVAEYGITVRWNKNYLKIIRIILERNNNFRLYGGVRFGSQITKETAFTHFGFDHIALCQGSGSPNIIPLKNNLANGIRKASDFLMSLQLTGSFKEDSIANLQIRLPILVVGGGLTALDAATEAQAYYPRQVLKYAVRFNQLSQSEQLEFKQSLNQQELEILNEYLEHAKLFDQENKQATTDKRKENFSKIMRELGGVKIIYRKSLKDSPAYRLNHEEVVYALKEGIEFCENITPYEAILDQHNDLSQLRCKTGEKEITLNVKSLLIAAGTKPNIVISKEDHDLETENNFLKKIPEELARKHEISPQFFTYINQEKQAISFFGDLHPDYHGNVVKAMASSKDGYPQINKLLATKNSSKKQNLFRKLDRQLIATVKEINILAPKIIELIIKAPLATQEFKPGQFYRLQNFAKYANELSNTKLLMEGLALTGASVNKKSGTISLIVLEMGGSSNLCRDLKIGEPVVLMGPTGTPTDIPKNKTIMLAGGGLGNAVLFSIGKAMRQNGCNVVYFAGYKKASDRYKIDEIEAAANVVIWACDEKSDFKARRKTDFVFDGNIVQAMHAYASGELGETKIKLNKVDHIIAIGSHLMMQAVKEARYQILKKHLNPEHLALGSINSPMQCMMKEICAQCIQKHIDPVTKEESYIYSCYNQDQELDKVSFSNLNDRLKQNSLQEKLTKTFLAKR